jgi:hypothetical protein
LEFNLPLSKEILIRGALELGSGRNPDFLEFRFQPELIKKAWLEPELISNTFLYQQKVTVGRNLDYTREMYTINTSL